MIMKKILGVLLSALFISLIFSFYSNSEAKTLREIEMENAATFIICIPILILLLSLMRK